MDEPRLRVCLERVVELDGVRLRLRDWPGLAGPLVHVPDPLSPTDTIIAQLAAAFPPRFRVLSLSPRGGSAYQVDARDLVATLDQFGFSSPILVGERLGAVAALLVAAWSPDRVGRLVLVDPTFSASDSGKRSLAARALRDCPPDVSALRARVECPMHELRWSVAAVQQLQDFLN